MTLRHRQRKRMTPERVADELRAPALKLVPLDPAFGLREYEQYFSELEYQVELLSGDAGMTMTVASLIGVDPARWYRRAVEEGWALLP